MSTRFTALTIKEGDAFLLEDNGWNCLFDSGKDDSILNLLIHKGIEELDLAICSHNDADHANGFIELLKSGIYIEEIWLPYWWASILDYSNNHNIDWTKIEGTMKKTNKSKIKKVNHESLFSDEHEPLTDEAFGKILADLARRYKNEQSTIFRKNLFNFIIKCLDKKLERHLDKELRNDIENIESRNIKEIAQDIKQGIADIIASQDVDAIFDRMNDEIAQIIVHEAINKGIDERIHNILQSLIHKYAKYLVLNKIHYIHNFIERLLSHHFFNQIAQKIADDIVRNITDDLGKCLSNRISVDLSWGPTHRSKKDIISSSRQVLKQDCFRYFYKHDEKAEAKNSLEIKFDNIMEIAVLAHERGCRIKWFEPMRNCANNPTPYSGFLALNSTIKRQVQRLKDDNTLAFALYLTEVNQYSLVFEYLKDGIPIVRFSADSDCKCSSQSPYEHSIIVTAPHHGAKANAKVYSAIKGRDIIWVRSDKISGNQGRPCDEFKSMKNRYCLACDKYNFESEICFEYNPWDKKWHHIRGEQCRCNKNQQ